MDTWIYNQVAKSAEENNRTFEDELEDIANLFIDGVSIYAVIDRDGLLEEKESPMDRQDVWRELYKNNIYKIK